MARKNYKYNNIGGIAKLYITDRITGETVPMEEWTYDPYTFFPVEQLQEAMKSAVAKEDYEGAAKIKKHLDFKTKEHGT